MDYIDLQPRKPQHIALSFSGGGFRAASFGLGCLAYLDSVTIDDKKITDLVHFISSASGGTITNLVYSVSRRKSIPFHTFYVTMHEKMLKGTLVIDRAFELLKDDTIWVKYGTK